MTDKNRRNAEAEVEKSSSQAADQSKKEVPSDERAPIYVRIGKDAKSVLDQYAVGHITNSKVIESLLEFYGKQDAETQNRIIRGEKTFNPLKEYEDREGKLSWAQHAFDNDRYVLAAKLYKALTDEPHSSEGFESFCYYRLGLCWIRLSYEARMKALEQPDDKTGYAVAIDAVDRARRYTKIVKDSLWGPLSNLVMHYNLACCHSLKAQYLVESALDPGLEVVGDLSEAKHETEPMTKVWKRIGDTWRKELKENDIRAVDAEAREAFVELEEIYRISSTEEAARHPDAKENPGLSAEGIWLVEAAAKDEDLIFLRSDKQKWLPEFDKWVEMALHDEKSTRSIIDTIKALLVESERSKSPRDV